MTARVKFFISVIVGAVAIAALLVAWWIRSTSDHANLQGMWRSDSYFIELKEGGIIGDSSLPAGICVGSRYSPEDAPIGIDGSWKKDFEADAGNGVRVKAIRKDGGGTCTFWASYDSSNATALNFGTITSPVKVLRRAP
ncbi:hypothetical protein OG196_09420 [Kitasatospora purpeofusca]|uniref:hypothetical protein n=1 Tax=Kitasatospora purpeofusca TaxID=67352 RepID=UPI002E12F420|nr:hypothetical protein OG196_09420 [Kitasatospora purpeofusca]